MRPLPYPQAQALVGVWHVARGGEVLRDRSCLDVETVTLTTLKIAVVAPMPKAKTINAVTVTIGVLG